MHIESAPYSVTASAYLGRIAVTLFWRLWWLMGIALAVIAVGAAIDARIAIVGLMCLFIIYPAIMTLACIRYGMSPEVALRSRATRVTITDDVLTLSSDDEHPDITIPTAAIAEAGVKGRFVVFSIGRHADDIVLVPAEALEPQDVAALMDKFLPESNI